MSKTMFVFMVSGVFWSLQFPYVKLPFAKVHGELFFWEAVRHLELKGLKVLAVNGDGASTNRRFVTIHKNSCKRGEVVYKAICS